MTARPLYARILRLRHVTPGGLLCFVYFEGALGLGILLALAELVTWWGILVLPASVALMVKLNDVFAALGSRSTTPDPAHTSAGAAVRRSLAERRRAAAATPPAQRFSDARSAAGAPMPAATDQLSPVAGRSAADASGAVLPGDRTVAGASTASGPAAAGGHDEIDVYGIAVARGAADVRGAAGAPGLTGIPRGAVRGDAAAGARTAGGMSGRGGAAPRFAGQKADARLVPDQAMPSGATRQGTVYGTRNSYDEVTGTPPGYGSAGVGGVGEGWRRSLDEVSGTPAGHGSAGPGGVGEGWRWSPDEVGGATAGHGPAGTGAPGDDWRRSLDEVGGTHGPAGIGVAGTGVAGDDWRRTADLAAGEMDAVPRWPANHVTGDAGAGRPWVAGSTIGADGSVTDAPGGDEHAASHTGWRSNPIRQSSRRGESPGHDAQVRPGEPDRHPGDARPGQDRREDAGQRAELDWLGQSRPGNVGRHGEPDRQGHQVRQNEPDWQHEAHRQNGWYRPGDVARRTDGDEPANLGRRTGVPTGRRPNESYRLPSGGPIQPGGGGSRAVGAPSARRSADGGTHRFAQRPGDPGDRHMPGGADRQPPPAAGHGRRPAGVDGPGDGHLRIDQRSDRGRHADTPQQRGRRSADRRYE